MSSGNIPMRPLGPPVALTTDEERTALFRRTHKEQLGQVHGKPALKRFVAPIHPQPQKRSGHRFTEADLDAFLRSLNKQLFPSALEGDPQLEAIGAEFWAARQACHAEVERRLIEERPTDETTLTAADRATTKAFLVRDRAHLLVFVGQSGVETIELCLALWQSHAHAWFTLATGPGPLWPKVAAWLSQHGSSDAVEHAHRDRRFAQEPPHRAAIAGAPRVGMPIYQAMLKERG